MLTRIGGLLELAFDLERGGGGGPPAAAVRGAMACLVGVDGAAWQGDERDRGGDCESVDAGAVPRDEGGADGGVKSVGTTLVTAQPG